MCSLVISYIHGDGSNSRKYLYAGDVADALDIILHLGQIGEIYNIGSNFEISNLDLAKTLIRQFGFKDDKCLEFVQDRAFNDRRYAVDYRKLKELGWKPRIGWEEGLKKTSKFYICIYMYMCVLYMCVLYVYVCNIFYHSINIYFFILINLLSCMV